MNNIFLKLLGLTFSGFNRKSTFLIKINKLIDSRYIGQNASYCFLCLLSVIFFIINCFSLTLSKSVFDMLSPYYIDVKAASNNIILFPKTFKEFFEKKMILQEEISALRLENDNLKMQIIDIEKLKKENNNLREVSGFKYDVNSKKMLEKVLGTVYGASEYHIMISAQNNCVKKGAVVISSTGLIGIIINAHNNMATVIPLTNERFSVSVKSESGEKIVLAGNGAELISTIMNSESTSQLKKGDILYTSGDGGIFQEGIPVAMVKDVKKNEITATPITDIEKTGYVWIIDAIDFFH